MGRLVYTAQCSLDGYTEDASGSFGFTRPSAEVHRWINERERGAGTYVFGRKMFQTMQVWDTDDIFDEFDDAESRDIMTGFAEHYRSLDKIVYSRTLASVDAPRTTLRSTFDAAELRAMADASTRDVSIGGPELAARALRAGIVDDIQLLFGPVSVGSGKPALPTDLRLELELTYTRSFSNGMVAMHYAVTSPRT